MGVECDLILFVCSQLTDVDDTPSALSKAVTNHEKNAFTRTCLYTSMDHVHRPSVLPILHDMSERAKSAILQHEMHDATLRYNAQVISHLTGKGSQGSTSKDILSVLLRRHRSRTLLRTHTHTHT